MMTLPVGITYEDWFNQLRIDRSELIDIPLRPSEENWVDDVELLLRNAASATLHLPRPDGFANWRDWASEFIKAYGGLV